MPCQAAGGHYHPRTDNRGESYEGTARVCQSHSGSFWSGSPSHFLLSFSPSLSFCSFFFFLLAIEYLLSIKYLYLSISLCSVAIM